MRVLLVTGVVAGGVGRHVEMLARGLADRGHDVTVACPREVADRFALGGSVVDLRVGAGPHPVHDLRALATLRRVMTRTDVVHAHGLRAGALAVAARASLGSRRRRRPRLVVTSHNAPPEGRAARAVYLLLEAVVARGADLVLAVSPDLVARARSAGATRTTLAVVPAAHTGRLEPQVARGELGAELGLGPEEQVVLAVGRLAPQKRLGLAVEAHAHLLGGAGAAAPHLVIAGEGPGRADLEAVAAQPRSRVHLLGHRQDVPALLAAADVVLSTARWEGQPVWLQEALQQGAAVVATDVGGTAQVVSDAAVLLPADVGPVQVAAEVRRVLEDAALRADLRRRALARAAELPTEDDALEAAFTAYLGNDVD